MRLQIYSARLSPTRTKQATSPHRSRAVAARPLKYAQVPLRATRCWSVNLPTSEPGERRDVSRSFTTGKAGASEKSCAEEEPPPVDGGSAGGRKARVVRAVALHSWAAGLGAFVVINYFWGSSVWPALLANVDVRAWSLVHAVSGMLFAGGIVMTSFLEYLVVRTRNEDIQRFWFSTATQAEWAVVLPGLTGSMVSGIAQSWHMYQCPIAFAPLHVKLPIHVLALFGVWWMVTDVATRDAAGDKPKQAKRLVSNLVSCLFVFALYAIMVLKP